MSITIRLPPDIEKRLTALAKKIHRSKSFVVREAIEEYIDDFEDFYLTKQIKANPGKIYTAEEVRKMCKLDRE